MTGSTAIQEKIKKMEDELKQLQRELDRMKRSSDHFEPTDVQTYLTEVYNG